MNSPTCISESQASHRRERPHRLPNLTVKELAQALWPAENVKVYTFCGDRQASFSSGVAEPTADSPSQAVATRLRPPVRLSLHRGQPSIASLHSSQIAVWLSHSELVNKPATQPNSRVRRCSLRAHLYRSPGSRAARAGFFHNLTVI